MMIKSKKDDKHIEKDKSYVKSKKEDKHIEKDKPDVKVQMT